MSLNNKDVEEYIMQSGESWLDFAQRRRNIISIKQFLEEKAAQHLCGVWKVSAQFVTKRKDNQSREDILSQNRTENFYTGWGELLRVALKNRYHQRVHFIVSQRNWMAHRSNLRKESVTFLWIEQIIIPFKLINSEEGADYLHSIWGGTVQFRLKIKDHQ